MIITEGSCLSLLLCVVVVDRREPEGWLQRHLLHRELPGRHLIGCLSVSRLRWYKLVESKENNEWKTFILVLTPAPTVAWEIFQFQIFFFYLTLYSLRVKCLLHNISYRYPSVNREPCSSLPYLQRTISFRDQNLLLNISVSCLPWNE